MSFTRLNNNTDSKPDSAKSRSWSFECFANTWSHQRRKRREKRRQQQHEQQNNINDNDVDSLCTKKRPANDVDDDGPDAKRFRANCSASDDDTTATLNCSTSSDHSLDALNAASKVEDACCLKSAGSNALGGRLGSEPENSETSAGESSGLAECLMKGELAVRKSDCGREIVLELRWVDGHNRELLHQLMQFFKNRFI